MGRSCRNPQPGRLPLAARPGRRRTPLPPRTQPLPRARQQGPHTVIEGDGAQLQQGPEVENPWAGATDARSHAIRLRIIRGRQVVERAVAFRLLQGGVYQVLRFPHGIVRRRSHVDRPERVLRRIKQSPARAQRWRRLRARRRVGPAGPTIHHGFPQAQCQAHHAFLRAGAGQRVVAVGTGHPRNLRVEARPVAIPHDLLDDDGHLLPALRDPQASTIRLGRREVRGGVDELDRLCQLGEAVGSPGW